MYYWSHVFIFTSVWSLPQINQIFLSHISHFALLKKHATRVGAPTAFAKVAWILVTKPCFSTSPPASPPASTLLGLCNVCLQVPSPPSTVKISTCSVPVISATYRYPFIANFLQLIRQRTATWNSSLQESLKHIASSKQILPLFLKTYFSPIPCFPDSQRLNQ